MNDSNKFTLLYCLLHVHVVHVDDYNLRITNKMCDVPNDFHVPNLYPLCSWLWPGAGCSRLPGLRLRHCLTGEVCCARRCHDVCCFLQILIIWSLMLFLHCFLTFLVCQEVTVFPWLSMLNVNILGRCIWEPFSPFLRIQHCLQHCFSRMRQANWPQGRSKVV